MTMTRPAENILEDILAQLESSAGNGVQQVTADEIAKAMRGQSGPRKVQKDDGLEDLVREAGSAADGLLRVSSAGDAAGIMGSGMKSLGMKILPGFGTAISLAADGAMKFYEFMNENLQQYESLNTAGMQTTNGMMGLYGSLATARLSLDEFMSATADTRDVLASLGSDGTQQFGNMLNAVMQTESTMGSLNMANEQMAKYLASNMKTQKAYGVFDRMTQNERNATNRQYMEDLNKYSKSLGISTDALAAKLANNADTVEGFGTQLALSQRGMDPKLAANTADNLGMVSASFGEFGGAFNEQLARFIEFGQVDLDSDIGKMFQNNDAIRNLFEQTREMALSGKLATQEGKDQLQSMLADDGLVASIDGNMTQFRAAFGDAATNQIIKFRNSLNNYNKDVNQVDDFWNNTMKNFNRTIENMYSGFKTGVADLFIDPKGFIKNIFGDKWGSWLLDGAFTWEIPDTPLVNSYVDFMKTFFEPVAWFWDALQGYGSGVASRFGSMEQPSWQNIVRALVPEWLANIIFDQAGEIAGASEMGAKLVDGANDLMNDTTEWMKEAGSKFETYDAEYSKAAMHTATSMMDSISKWWNKPSSQTVIQNSVTQKTKPVQPTVNVESPTTDSQPQSQLIQAIDKLSQNDMSELLSKLLEEMKKTGDASEQQVKILRKLGSAPGQIN